MKRKSVGLVILVAILVSGCGGPPSTQAGISPAPLATRLMTSIVTTIAPQPSAAPATSTKWEYKLVDYGLKPAEPDWPSGDGNTSFNQLGQEGWEYVDSIAVGKYIAIFKRPVK